MKNDSGKDRPVLKLEAPILSPHGKIGCIYPISSHHVSLFTCSKIGVWGVVWDKASHYLILLNKKLSPAQYNNMMGSYSHLRRSKPKFHNWIHTFDGCIHIFAFFHYSCGGSKNWGTRKPWASQLNMILGIETHGCLPENSMDISQWYTNGLYRL